MTNKTTGYEFTIVVPVYNEEDNMMRLEKTLADYLPKAAQKACVLFVNDGSKDMSLEGIKAACERNKDFYYISFVKNCGLSAAIKAGFDYCESKYVGYIDADLQTTPEDFNLLLKNIDSYSMAIGLRANRKDSIFKNLQSKIANGFRKMMTHDGAADTGCPLKVLHTDVAKRIPMFKGMHRFLPALVLLQDGGSYEQIPVRHFPRTAGKSKYHLWNRLIGPFNDCFAYRWMKPRYINYRVGDDNVSMADSGNISKERSNNISKANSSNISKERSNNISMVNSDYISKVNSGNISKERSNNVSKVNSDYISKVNSGNISKEDSNNVSKANSGNFSKAGDDKLNQAESATMQ